MPSMHGSVATPPLSSLRRESKEGKRPCVRRCYAATTASHTSSRDRNRHSGLGGGGSADRRHGGRSAYASQRQQASRKSLLRGMKVACRRTVQPPSAS